jgi:anti-anti-sigma regulatory factor
MNRCVPSAGFEPGHLPGSPRGPMTLSVTLPAEMGEGPHVARLVVGGMLDRDGLSALIYLAHIGLRRGCRELVLDLHGLTDFPSALFSELRKLADVAERSRCELRLDGLDAAVAAVIDAAGRDDDIPSDGA